MTELSKYYFMKYLNIIIIIFFFKLWSRVNWPNICEKILLMCSSEVWEKSVWMSNLSAWPRMSKQHENDYPFSTWLILWVPDTHTGFGTFGTCKAHEARGACLPSADQRVSVSKFFWALVLLFSVNPQVPDYPPAQFRLKTCQDLILILICEEFSFAVERCSS